MSRVTSLLPELVGFVCLWAETCCWVALIYYHWAVICSLCSLNGLYVSVTSIMLSSMRICQTELETRLRTLEERMENCTSVSTKRVVLQANRLKVLSLLTTSKRRVFFYFFIFILDQPSLFLLNKWKASDKQVIIGSLLWSISVSTLLIETTNPRWRPV